MSNITMKQLLEAGVHFGHQTRRWNPKMKPFLFGARNGIYIIDLQKTVRLFRTGYNFIKDRVAEGDSILFVGTKKQAQDAIVEEATRCGQYYVNNRWLGGMLTNFSTIKKSIDKLNEISTVLGNPDETNYTKKELVNLGRLRSAGNLHTLSFKCMHGDCDSILNIDRDRLTDVASHSVESVSLSNHKMKPSRQLFATFCNFTTKFCQILKCLVHAELAELRI